MRDREFRTNWTLLRNRVSERWPQISSGNLTEINGHADRLYRAIVRQTGVTRGEAAQQLSSFLKTCEAGTPRIDHTAESHSTSAAR